MQVFCSEGKVAGMGCKTLACATAYTLLINSALKLTILTITTHIAPAVC